MDWNRDTELQDIFRSEMDERAGRMIEGAAALGQGELSPDELTQMMREAHTIKGTARVMGYAAIADGAETLETAWKAVQHGEAPAGPELAAALGALAREMMSSVEAPAETGTENLPEARAGVAAALQAGTPSASETVRSSLPPALSAPEPASEVIDHDVAANASGELGGLLAFQDSWVREESTGVDTGKLYRLINRIAELRLDASALVSTVAALRTAASGSPSEVALLASRWDDAVAAISEAVFDIQDQAMTLVATPLRRVTDTFPGLIRYLSKKTGKEIRLELVGDDIEVDRQVLDAVADSLRHLVVNAAEHGVESPEQRLADGKPPTATLVVRASIVGGRLRLVVADDGAGVDWVLVERVAREGGYIGADAEVEAEELHSLLFADGITTSLPGNEFSGSGKGLAVVADTVADLKGSLEFETEPGRGTTVTLTLPTSRSLQPALIVAAGGQQWGLPDAAVLDRFPILDAVLHSTDDGMAVSWRDLEVPVKSFAAAVGLAEAGLANDVVVIATPSGPFALTVSMIIGTREVAARSLGPLVAGTPHITGAAMLGGGDLALLIEPAALVERARKSSPIAESGPLVLVVDDSRGARQVVTGALAVGGFRTLAAAGVDEAVGLLDEHQVDALVVDFSMPDHDGISLVEQVRSQLGNAMPIVMVSSVATPEDQQRAFRSGVDAYFDKADFREGALAAMLNSLLSTRSTMELGVATP